MDADEFRQFGREVIDYIADYIENVRDRDVLPSVEPGYLQHMIPEKAPEEPEQWRDVFRDLDRVVMPGITHWQSPQFHAYYPAGSSYPSIIGELISAGLGVLGFNWMTSPACTELEVVMMDWMAKMLGLPDEFLSSSNGPGGGLIQGSASEAVFSCLLAAKNRTLRKIVLKHPEFNEGIIQDRIVAYSSDHANSSVEKAARLGSVKLRTLQTDNHCRLRGNTLKRAIIDDLKSGLIPVFVCAALGTTATCAFDVLTEIGPICREFNIWLHIDAAYAGAAFICPEYRNFLSGVEFADSFNFNPHKWLNVNFDCSALWVRNKSRITDTFGVDRIYLENQNDTHSAAPDFRNWEVPLGRRFRALKVWFTLRIYGVSGLQKHIRKQIALAQKFANYVKTDSKFELICEPSMALVCFKLKGENMLTRRLLNRLLARKKVYVIAGEVRGSVFIRFAISSRLCEQNDIEFAWREIREQAAKVKSRADDSDVGCVSERVVEKELFIGSKVQEINLAEEVKQYLLVQQGR